MHHLPLYLFFVLGVDAIVPHSHYTHNSHRLHRDLQTLGAFPRSSRAMNSADSLVHLSSGSSDPVQALQLKREVTDRDWARASSVGPNEPERGVNYLSNTGPPPAAQLVKPMPVSDSAAKVTPASTSSPVNPHSIVSPRPTTKSSYGAKDAQHHKGEHKHYIGHGKKMKKTMRF